VTAERVRNAASQPSFWITVVTIALGMGFFVRILYPNSHLANRLVYSTGRAVVLGLSLLALYVMMDYFVNSGSREGSDDD